MATIGKVSAVFTASTSGLKAGVAEASSSFSKLAGDVAKLKSGMGSLVAIQGAQLFGQVASAAKSAASSFVNMGQAQAETIDVTSKLSRRLGMTYGELSGLALAGDLAGVSMDSIGAAATKADVAFVKASQGSALAQAALAGVGLSVDQLASKSPAERFQAMADAIAALPSPAERARAAVGLFGRSGAELLPLFEGGAGSIKAATDEAQRFGLALTNDQGLAVENMNDAFTRASASISGVVGQVVAYLAPAIQTVADEFTKFVGEAGGTTIGQTIGEGILIGAEFLATIADGVISGLTGVWGYVSEVGAQWTGIWELGNRTAAFLSGVSNAFKFILGAGILGLTAPVAALLKGADFLAKSVGVNLGVDSFIAGADAFNQSIVNSMNEASTAAGSDFNKAMFGSGEGVGGGALKGPASTAIADAIKKAREQAAAKDGKGDGEREPKDKPKPKPEPLFTGPSAEALKATDSRSKEGIAEMFRLMRGGGKSVAEEQLEQQKKTNELLSEREPEVFADIAP